MVIARDLNRDRRESPGSRGERSGADKRRTGRRRRE